MDILTALSKGQVRDRLGHLLRRDAQSSHRQGIQLVGDVSVHQLLIRVRKRRFSLPWRAVFRGAMLDRPNGSAITGKFDSNWAMYFIGYPALAGVVLNVGITSILQPGAMDWSQIIWFLLVPSLVCFVLSELDIHDRHHIRRSILVAVDGHEVSELLAPKEI
ncbi:MAG: hypothetical protein ACI915_003441 [Gammaproteobacteria bacterium]|jgi:hypothetical protein